MNVIEAAKKMAEGKTVIDPMGFQMKAKYGNLIFLLEPTGQYDEDPADMYLSDLLSDKWTVADE